MMTVVQHVRHLFPPSPTPPRRNYQLCQELMQTRSRSRWVDQDGAGKFVWLHDSHVIPPPLIKPPWLKLCPGPVGLPK